MNVLFIGGTGNISSAVTSLAVRKGIDLYLFNRGKQALDVPGVTSITGSVDDLSAIDRTLGRRSWDVVVDWIAFHEEDVRRDAEYFRGRTKQYVFISSASCYQKPPTTPFITESTPLDNPYWQYSRDKIACERYLMDLYATSGFPVTIIRPSLTYNTVIPLPIGGWKEFTVVDRMRSGRRVIVHGDGTSHWVVTHADDFAEGFVGILGHQGAIGEAIQITTDEVLTWDQIYRTVAEAAGAEAKIAHIPSDVLGSYDEGLRGSLLGDKAWSVMFDNAKIKRLVPGFKASIRFSDGIRRTLAWFDADPSRKVIRKETHDFIDRIISRFERSYPAEG